MPEAGVEEVVDDEIEGGSTEKQPPGKQIKDGRDAPGCGGAQDVEDEDGEKGNGETKQDEDGLNQPPGFFSQSLLHLLLLPASHLRFRISIYFMAYLIMSFA